MRYAPPARAAHSTVLTVAEFELGNTTPQRRTVEAIQAALEAAGVEFIPKNGGGVGVRLAKRDAN